MGTLINCFRSNSLQNQSKPNNNLDKFEEAILRAKIARDQVKSYIKKMSSFSAKQKTLAKEQLKQNNREKAKLHLSRAKAYEVQIETGNGQLMMLEQQIVQIDQAKSEVGAIKALEQGNVLLKSLQSEISVEKWEKIGEDMDDARERKRELDEFFGRNGVSVEECDEEINQEIEKLLESEGKKESVGLPEVPSKREERGVSNDERERVLQMS